MTSALPRVVGLLATQNRPAMAHRAAHLFFEQDYAGPKSLVVFDDGDQYFETCEALNAADVVYHTRVSLPAKRNEMVRHVDDRDAIYFVWDDDDYHGPARVRHQVDALLAAPDATACLLRPFLYFNQVKNETRQALEQDADATLAFRWAFWEERAWDETIDPGSGFRMISRRSRTQLIRIDGRTDYIVVWHGDHRFEAAPDAFTPHWLASHVDAVEANHLLALRCVED
jgi:hypothetical protein